jgi:hypothetical protein
MQQNALGIGSASSEQIKILEHLLKGDSIFDATGINLQQKTFVLMNKDVI